MHRCTTKNTRGKACKEREVPPVLYARHTRRHTTIGTDDPTLSHQTMIVATVPATQHGSQNAVLVCPAQDPGPPLESRRQPTQRARYGPIRAEVPTPGRCCKSCVSTHKLSVKPFISANIPLISLIASCNLTHSVTQPRTHTPTQTGTDALPNSSAHLCGQYSVGRCRNAHMHVYSMHPLCRHTCHARSHRPDTLMIPKCHRLSDDLLHSLTACAEHTPDRLSRRNAHANQTHYHKAHQVLATSSSSAASHKKTATD
jgi:hypothetical protein